MWQTGIFSNVDSEVGVERLQLLGQELIGQRVETIRAPVQSGPFQKVKPGKTNSGLNLKGILKNVLIYIFLPVHYVMSLIPLSHTVTVHKNVSHSPEAVILA